jgi:hypothetical protein
MLEFAQAVALDDRVMAKMKCKNVGGRVVA